MNATPAATAYAANIAAANTLLDEIRALIAKHEAKAANDAWHGRGIHYGHVGDMAHVTEKLTEVAAFLRR